MHQVKWEGETLSIHAKWYTGSLNNWKAIAKVNPALDPNRIVIGNDIRIPESLLITRNPMPKSFLAGFGLEKKVKLPVPEAINRPEPAGIPAPVKTVPQTEPDKKGAQPDMIRPPEVPNKEILPAVIPQTEPAIKPVPADMGEKPVLPEKVSSPLTDPPAQPEKQSPSETDRPTELPDKPLHAAPSSQPKAEKKPPQPKAEPPPEKEEPPLFGPRGYSN